MKLQTKGHHSEQIEPVLEELQQKGYLREDRYRDATIRRLLKKHHADWSICRQLEQEGIAVSREHLEKARNELRIDTSKQIQQLIRKKTALLSPDDPKSQEKILRYLLSKGHPYQQCVQVLARQTKNVDKIV